MQYGHSFKNIPRQRSAMLPYEEEWKRMPLYGKRSVEEVLQMLIKDMKNIGSIYTVNLLQLLPTCKKLHYYD